MKLNIKLRIYHQILRVAKLYELKIFLLHLKEMLEKILMYKLRKIQNIKIYGYQFASLNKNHGILNIRLNKYYYPNKILTVGKINYSLLINSKINKSIQ